MPTAPQGEDDAPAQSGGLFSQIEGDPPPSTDVETLAGRLVGIDFGQLAQVTKPTISPKRPAASKPQTLVLNLFDDVVFTGIVEDVEATSAGHALWGRLDGVGLGTFTLVVNGRVVIGTVRTPDAVYTIRTAGDGTYVIRQIDESSLPPLGEPLEPHLSPLSPRDAPAEAHDVPSDDGSEIDVMVVYTPLAKHLEGGRAAIEALIDLFVAETNQAYANSGVIHRINLMLREEVDYTEDGGSSIDLSRLSNGSDGHMDHVHERRDMYGADLVHILVGRSDVGGRALFIALESSTDGEALGFGLTVSWCGGLCFAHELGHNMGLLHDRYQIGVPRTGSHYGYVNQRMFDEGAPESARWRTIMSYPTQCAEVADFYCEQIGSFSNPENSYNGDPMGVPADHPSTGVDGPADAVRTLNDRREVTANFRRSSASPTPRVHLTLSPYWLAEDGGVSTVTATLHRPSSADTTVTVSSDAVTLSANGVLTIPAGQTVSSGAVTITGVDNSDQTGDVSVTVSATAANPSSLGVIAPEPVALVIADDETTPVVTLSLSPAEIVEYEGRTFVTATLGNRSGTDTTVTVSAEPAELIEQRWDNTLTIPAGQTESIGFGVSLLAVDNDELAEATQTVTVSGTSENPHGVAGPENVTLTIIDDEAPFFADDSIAYTFTAGIAVSRFLPEAEFGNGKLTYSLSPAPSNDVTFTPEPPARIGVSATSVAAGETSYTLTATDADGDTDTMTISITVRKGVCPNSAAVSGYSDPGIVHDCEALLASRDTLSVDQSLNWDEDLPIDEWKGVELADGRVVELRMSSEGIVGTIPSELGNLANLQGLSLWGNRLTGGIPKELGNLANLQGLSLWGNRLTGGIPKELGNLANLRSLWLSGNQLTGGIPEELGSLSNLQTLDLYGNQLTGVIPKELGNLANLRSLYLGGNQLTGVIPKELGNLSNLWLLFLYDNQLTGVIPKELGNLANLQALYLSGNQLTGGIPEELGSLAVLRGLNLYGNQLTGVIPKELGNLANLRALRLQGNQLTGVIPKELGNLSNLSLLFLYGNQLTGEIPKELGNLSNLQKLYLGGNLLTGCVPDGLRDVPGNDFDQLGLPFCDEHPCVSGGAVVDATNDGLRSDCETLLAARDALVGTATLNWSADTPIAEWNGVVLGGTPGRVTELLLGGLSLNGGIPTELGSLADLRGLNLSENQLTGEIPTELGSLSNLQSLDLWGNQLTGEVPKELANLPNIELIDVTGNQLTGEIPTELGSLANLTKLYLSSNQLTGEIPMELGSLANLQLLDLSNNKLTGEIPTELGILTGLTALGLNDNDLVGSIPASLGSLSKLERLYLSNNRLTGCVPPRLRDVPDNDFNELGLPFCPLSPPEAPTIGSVTSEMDSLTISWTPPLSDGGSDITAYDLRHIETASDETVDSNWTVVEDVWTTGSGTLEYTLTGLTADTQYDIQVRAVNAVGDGPWSATAMTTTAAASACVAGGAVSDATNTGLVSDCEALLASEDVLAVSATLNWSADTAISDWDGVTLRGTTVRVRYLDLRDRGLGGSIPADLGRLSNLTYLNLRRNDLTGPIPTELDSLTSLRVLNLHSNELSGTIPDLSSMTHLQQLYLANNSLSGGLPEWLGDMTNVKELWLWGNELSGPIPNLSGMTALDRLKLQDNKLTGGIPAWFGEMTNLRYLYLHRNPLGGTIPPELGGMTKLRYVWLHSNELTGEIPEDLGSLDNLWDLNLHTNALEGSIPAELGDLSSLTHLRLHRNGLSGTIPDELGNLSSLKFMWLHGNQLTGEIPAELGNLAKLQRLYLSENQLTGDIPAELDNLVDTLTHWRLAGNRFTGCVPAGLAAVENSDLDQLGLEPCAVP